jgi:hypothetical protein
MKIAVEERVNVMLIAAYIVLFLPLYKASTYTVLLHYKIYRIKLIYLIIVTSFRNPSKLTNIFF